MTFGQLNSQQLDAVAAVVQGRQVHDLGCGNCRLAMFLSRLGAAAVIAIDQELPNNVAPVDGLLVLRQERFEVVADEIDIAFVSWPTNNEQVDRVLTQLLRHAKTIIYLGSNTDANACGGPAMFELFRTRKLLTHLPDRRNTLLILGEPLQSPRRPTGEEYAGASAWRGGSIMMFEETQTYDARPTTRRYQANKPEPAIISSAIVSHAGSHDVVRLWNRGGLAGELTLKEGDAVPLMALLRLDPT